MNRHTNPADDLESALRDTLLAGASHAPGTDRLAQGIRDRERQHARRRVGIVLSGVAVVAVLGAAAALPSALSNGTNTTQSADAGSGQSILRYRGVEVAVPADWLDPARVSCGKALQNAAFVARLPQRACAGGITSPAATSVVMSALTQSTSDPDTQPGTPSGESSAPSSLGHYENVEHGVLIVVTGPDRMQREKILASVHVLEPSDSVGPCAARAKPEITGHAATEPLVATATSVTVCSYDNNWLSSDAALSSEQARKLTSDLQAAEPKAPAVYDCPQPAPWLADYWVLVFDTPTGVRPVTVTPGCAAGDGFAKDASGDTVNAPAELLRELSEYAGRR